MCLGTKVVIIVTDRQRLYLKLRVNCGTVINHSVNVFWVTVVVLWYVQVKETMFTWNNTI